VISAAISAGSPSDTVKGLIGAPGGGAWNGADARGSAWAGCTPSASNTPAVAAVLPVMRKTRSSMSRRDMTPSS
jgi:hypothetical protein